MRVIILILSLTTLFWRLLSEERKKVKLISFEEEALGVRPLVRESNFVMMVKWWIFQLRSNYYPIGGPGCGGKIGDTSNSALHATLRTYIYQTTTAH